MIPTENVSALSSVLLVATREPSNDVTHDPLAKIHGQLVQPGTCPSSSFSLSAGQQALKMDSQREEHSHGSQGPRHTTKGLPKETEDTDTDLPPLQRRLSDPDPANAQLARQNSHELAPEQHQVTSADGQDRQQVAPNDNGRHGAPAVRLDMNLDVDIQLKAKIKGDITLSIL